MRTPSTGNASPPDDSPEAVETGMGGNARAKTFPNVKGRPAPSLLHETR